MDTKILLISLMLIIGLLELVVAIIFYIREKKFKTHGIKTEAKIIKLERIGRAYRPTIEYQTVDGKIEVKKIMSSSKIFYPFNEGDQVNIYYDKNDLKRYRFENNRIWNFLIMMLFAFGIVSFIWTFIIFLVL